jgi:hypothetical protein
MFTHLLSLGYTIDILHHPWTCFNASFYAVLIISDPESFATPIETRKLVRDVAEGGLNVVVVGEWDFPPRTYHMHRSTQRHHSKDTEEHDARYHGTRGKNEMDTQQYHGMENQKDTDTQQYHDTENQKDMETRHYHDTDTSPGRNQVLDNSSGWSTHPMMHVPWYPCCGGMYSLGVNAVLKEWGIGFHPGSWHGSIEWLDTFRTRRWRLPFRSGSTVSLGTAWTWKEKEPQDPEDAGYVLVLAHGMKDEWAKDAKPVDIPVLLLVDVNGKKKEGGRIVLFGDSAFLDDLQRGAARGVHGSNDLDEEDDRMAFLDAVLDYATSGRVHSLFRDNAVLADLNRVHHDEEMMDAFLDPKEGLKAVDGRPCFHRRAMDEQCHRDYVNQLKEDDAVDWERQSATVDFDQRRREWWLKLELEQRQTTKVVESTNFAYLETMTWVLVTFVLAIMLLTRLPKRLKKYD